MGFPILVRWHLYIESGPRWHWWERLPDRPWQGQPWLPRTRLILRLPNPPVCCQVVDQRSNIVKCWKTPLFNVIKVKAQFLSNQINLIHVLRINLKSLSCLQIYPYSVVHRCGQPTISLINTLRPRQNGCHFLVDIFKCIFFNKNIWNPIKKIHWNSFLRFQLTACSDNGLAPTRQQAVIWTN